MAADYQEGVNTDLAIPRYQEPDLEQRTKIQRETCHQAYWKGVDD